MEEQEKYDGSSIQVLEGLEAVRKRPAMYIGDISQKGLHHLVYEVVDNSIDEALAGFCDEIAVHINEDNSITVQDNGRGIPVDMHPKEHKSALEVVMTVLHAGGKFNKDSYKVSGGLHGVGVSCVNALSTKMHVEVYRNGQIHCQDYAKGKPLSPVHTITEAEAIGNWEQRKTGTFVQFWPDDTIFTETVYHWEILANRMRELAFLNAGIKIVLKDKRVMEEHTLEDGTKVKECKREAFYSEKGLSEFVRYIDNTRTPLISEVIHLSTDKYGTIHLDVITFSGNGEPTLHPDFLGIIEDTCALRDRYYPTAKVSVLSNSTQLGREDVVQALKRCDNRILKLDAGTDEMMRRIDLPVNSSLTVETIVGWLQQFSGDFVLQTCFLRGEHNGLTIDNTTKEELQAWYQAVDRLQPKQIMIYVIDRKTPEESLEKISREQMEQIAAPLIQKGFDVSISA